MNNYFLAVLSLTFFVTGTIYASQSKGIAQLGKVELVQSGFGFTEGPAVDKEGNVYFSDQPNDKIFKWDAGTNAITTFLEGTGRSNGMAFDKKGFLITCADMYGELWRIAPDGTHEVLATNYKGKRLNGPNDLWINPNNGGIYITDPIFPRDYWEAGDPRIQSWPPTRSEHAETGKGGHVYYLAPGASELLRVSAMDAWNSDSWPNGIVGSPDGKKLYVNTWAPGDRGGIWEFKINSDGKLSNIKKISDIGGDGMSLDGQGNIYISNASGVVILNSSGEKLSTINTGGSTNNVFAGKDQKTLFITTVSGVVSVKMSVAGVENQ